MNSKALLLCFVGLLLPFAAAPRAISAEIGELARSARPAIVKLVIRDAGGQEVSSGSGFFISDSGRIVTNYHVVDDAERVEAVLADGRKIPVTGWLAEDKTNDIAIVQADFKPSATEILPLADFSQAVIQAGERVVVVGAPQGLAGTVSEGIVSAIRAPEDLEKFDRKARKGRESLLQITAAISPGSSGSPVIDLRGCAVGVAVANLSGGQNLNFAVPVHVVHRLLGTVSSNVKLHSFGGPGIMVNLLISAAAFGGLYWGFKRIFRISEPAPRRRATERC